MGLSSDAERKSLSCNARRDLVGAYFFARLEAYRFAWRDGDFLTSARIASHATLPWFYNKYSKSPQLNSFTTLQRVFERIEDRFHRNFRFYFCDIQLLRYTVYDVLLYHAEPPLN